MGKTLVLTEKPSVGREIAHILHCSQKGNGCLIGSRYIVTWALGHLITLADPEAYDDRYKTWKLEDLPMLPKPLKLVVIKETSKQFAAVSQLLRQSDVDDLIIATDAGREGELVARWILQKAGWRKPIKRLWISSQTEKAIREGFNSLKPGAAYDALFAAAESRAQADWYVGLNVTRALTCKYNAQLSAGRVQTPTLAMVVQREEEIQKFTPKAYWTITAQSNSLTLHWLDKASGQNRIFDALKAEQIMTTLKGLPAKILEVRKELKKELPPLAYDLTELQRDANRQYGFSAKKTSTIMQQLYEQHKIVTYPRTDSRFLTEDIVPTLQERLKTIAVGPYQELARSLLRGKIAPSKRLVDNSKVSDHHAIIPTEQPVFLSKLSREEYQIFDLIVRRFIAVLSSAFEYEHTSLKADIGGEIFGARGRFILKKGWRNVYDFTDHDDDGEEDLEDVGGKVQDLPSLTPRDILPISGLRSLQGKTKPPKRFTEATLLSAMENPGQWVDNKAMRETLEKTSGLGTPATRAEIIEKLFSSFYLERNGKEIVPTSKGIQLIGLVPPELRSPELTAKWEHQLSEISKGKANKNHFLQEIIGYSAKLVGEVVGSSQNYRHDNLTRAKCPDCGKYLLQVKGKKGEMLVCQDRECGYRQGISLQSNARCPQCHKKLQLKGEGENRIFFCACGYREKLAAFSKRKDLEGKKGAPNKREVSQYLDRQKHEAPLNTALAEALAKLKLDQ